MTKITNKRKVKKLSAYQLRREILLFFTKNPKKRLNAKQIIKKFNIANSPDSVKDALTKLTEQGQLFNIKDDKYKIEKDKKKIWTPRLKAAEKAAKANRVVHEGRVDMIKSGSAYIICEGVENDIYVPAKKLKGALNGDIVKVELGKPNKRGKADGKVVKVIKRACENFIGTLKKYGKRIFVIPDGNHMTEDIIINFEDINGADDGDKVVVKVVDWPEKHNHNPRGIVTMLFGEVGGSEIAMQSILLNNGFNLVFPESVMAEAKALPRDISEEEIAKRRDMRKITTFTIDPHDAKDFDDALSFERLDNGNIEIGVHIADVSHYVRPGTQLDKEAYFRSTSVYLVDRVLPMLPETLSNELCSLRPGEEKYTFSAVFTFNENYKIVDRWFGKTVTFSDRRYAYEEAQEILESGEGDFAEELRILNKIAYQLRKKKFKNGAIAFDAPEVKFKLDENGKPISVYVKTRKDAHLLIEDFMLLANKEVAKFIAKKCKPKEVPFVYRTHDLPNMDKVAEFSRFAKELGFKMEVDTPEQVSKSFNKLAKAAKKDEHLAILEPIAIRTMSKAEYTTDNIGHYGLGFDYYSHFTSPIRRYSDVLAHRILELNLDKHYFSDKMILEEKCKHVSNMERKAMTAERESIKYKQVEFIMDQIGKEFDGIISGIIDRGFFVELKENKAEGLIGFDNFEDVFEISDGRLFATGKRTGRTFKMGDSLRVKILDANIEKRQIEMEIVE